MNGGNCTAPGVCSCPPGYQGPYCEGGINYINVYDRNFIK